MKDIKIMFKFKDYYEIKKDCGQKERTKSAIIQRLNEVIGIANQDVRITIEPLSKRSINALSAYWCLIKAVVEWDSDNNGYSSKVWDEYFKRGTQLVTEFDMMPFWKMKYKQCLDSKYSLRPSIAGYYILKNRCKPYDILDLGMRITEKTRSLSNKGDVTKTEMQKLLMTVIEFGAKNEIPNCFIRDDELDRLLSFKGWKDE